MTTVIIFQALWPNTCLIVIVFMLLLIYIDFYYIYKNEVRRIFEFYNDPIQLSFHIPLCSVVHDAMFYNYSECLHGN